MKKLINSHLAVITRAVALCCAILPFGFSVGSSAEAATLTADRNVESDWDHDNVYQCLGLGCTVVQNSAMKLPVTMPKTAVGVRPSATVDIAGKEGAFAVSASDVSGNESGLSVPLPFDKSAPLTPTGPQLAP